MRIFNIIEPRLRPSSCSFAFSLLSSANSFVKMPFSSLTLMISVTIGSRNSAFHQSHKAECYVPMSGLNSGCPCNVKMRISPNVCAVAGDTMPCIAQTDVLPSPAKPSGSAGT